MLPNVFSAFKVQYFCMSSVYLFMVCCPFCFSDEDESLLDEVLGRSSSRQSSVSTSRSDTVGNRTNRHLPKLTKDAKSSELEIHSFSRLFILVYSIPISPWMLKGHVAWIGRVGPWKAFEIVCYKMHMVRHVFKSRIQWSTQICFEFAKFSFYVVNFHGMPFGAVKLLTPQKGWPCSFAE